MAERIPWLTVRQYFRHSRGVWLGELEQMPPAYGLAWHDPVAMRAFCLPLPLNRIAGSFRAWWLQIRRPCPDDPIPKAFDDGYQRGYAAGYKQGEGHRHRLYGTLLREVRSEVAAVRADYEAGRG